MIRRGRPRGSLGEVSRRFVALAAAAGPITVVEAAQRLQLSYREASWVANNLQLSGYLVAQMRSTPAGRPGRPAKLLSASAPEVPAAPCALDDWMRQRP